MASIASSKHMTHVTNLAPSPLIHLHRSCNLLTCACGVSYLVALGKTNRD